MKRIEFNIKEYTLIKHLINQAEWNKKLDPLYNSILSKIDKAPERTPASKTLVKSMQKMMDVYEKEGFEGAIKALKEDKE